jgi:hypothetical protein
MVFNDVSEKNIAMQDYELNKVKKFQILTVNTDWKWGS